MQASVANKERLARIAAGVLAIGTMSMLEIAVASGQRYPSRPIRIVTLEPGGGLDLAARLTAQRLASNLGQNVIVDNRGGASGVIAAQTVAKASPDGYTLLYYGNPLWILPLLQKTPYDPLKDFSPVTQ